MHHNVLIYLMTAKARMNSKKEIFRCPPKNLRDRKYWAISLLGATIPT